MTPEKEPRAERRQREWRCDHQVEAGNCGQRAQKQDRRQEQLIQGVGKRRLARRRIGVPQRPGSGHQRAVDPEMPRPEDHREVADVEDARQAQAAGKRDARDQNGERRPERSSGNRTKQLSDVNRLSGAAPCAWMDRPKPSELL